mmetsp:Transcript_17025/g.42027  ORF Transcript_17025/g.42027 Transcript_17025/m.42027 type:complete len:346 (-) Transcript_17025:744-1781(-)
MSSVMCTRCSAASSVTNQSLRRNPTGSNEPFGGASPRKAAMIAAALSWAGTAGEIKRCMKDRRKSPQSHPLSCWGIFKRKLGSVVLANCRSLVPFFSATAVVATSTRCGFSRCHSHARYSRSFLTTNCVLWPPAIESRCSRYGPGRCAMGTNSPFMSSSLPIAPGWHSTTTLQCSWLWMGKKTKSLSKMLIPLVHFCTRTCAVFCLSSNGSSASFSLFSLVSFSKKNELKMWQRAASSCFMSSCCSFLMKKSTTVSLRNSPSSSVSRSRDDTSTVSGVLLAPVSAMLVPAAPELPEPSLAAPAAPAAAAVITLALAPAPVPTPVAVSVAATWSTPPLSAAGAAGG